MKTGDTPGTEYRHGTPPGRAVQRTISMVHRCRRAAGYLAVATWISALIGCGGDPDGTMSSRHSPSCVLTPQPDTLKPYVPTMTTPVDLMITEESQQAPPQSRVLQAEPSRPGIPLKSLNPGS